MWLIQEEEDFVYIDTLACSKSHYILVDSIKASESLYFKADPNYSIERDNYKWKTYTGMLFVTNVVQNLFQKSPKNVQNKSQNIEIPFDDLFITHYTLCHG